MHGKGLVAAFALSASVVAGAGCSAGVGRPSGGSYWYEECGSGCPVAGTAMASGGAVAHIAVAAERVAAVRASDPSVAAVRLEPGRVEVRSGLAGHAVLELLDGAGHVVDAMPILVEATAKIGFAVASTHGGSVAVLEGASQRLQVTPQDAWGHVTVGVGSIAFSFDGPLSALAAPVSGDAVPFAGTAPGAAAVTASTAGAGAGYDPVVSRLPIEVVDPRQLVALDAVVRGGDSGDPQEVNVDVAARAAFGAVYGAACTWTTDPAVVVVSQSVATFEAPAHATTRFRVAEAGHFTARCAVGPVATSVTLRR